MVEIIDSDARINHAHRLAQMPCGQRDEGLNRKIKLGAKAAADGGRNNAHGFGSDPENLRDVGAVHVRGLGAGLNLDLVVDPAGKAGLRFDVGVLDKAGLVFVFDHNVRFRQSLLHIAANHAASDQHIILAAGMDAFGVRCERGGNCSQRRQLFPGDRKICESRASMASASPTTAATASPRNRASTSANTGWSAKRGITP